MMSSTEPAWTSEDNIEVHMHIRWNMGQVQPQVVLGKNKELCRTAKKTKRKLYWSQNGSPEFISNFWPKENSTTPLDEPSEQYKDFGLIPAEIIQQQQRLLCMSFHCKGKLLGAWSMKREHAGHEE